MKESEGNAMKKDIEWLKEEIGELPCVDTVFNSGGSSYIDSAVPVMVVYDLIDQLDEPEVLSQELPVIPKYVADYIDDRKEADFPIYQAIRIARENSRFEHSHLKEWLRTNKGQETFSRAWLDGYEVEEEPKYFVRENNYLLCKWKNEVIDYVEALGREITDLVELKLTKQEIKDYDERYWAFAEPVE